MEANRQLDLFAVLTESSPDGVEVKDRQGRFLQINSAGARILGRKVEEILGHDNRDLFPPEIARRLTESDRRVVETGIPETDTFEAPAADGPRTYHKTCAPYRDPAGAVVGLIGIVRDVTEREHAEEARNSGSARIIRQQNALLELARTEQDDFEPMLKRILQVDAETLEVDRVSFWTFSEARDAIVCTLLYRRGAGSCEKGTRLAARDYPRYFEALEDSRVVAANDACVDPRSSEFAQGYLRPLGITSMMDVPVRIHGTLFGILCHEHVGPIREWQLQEQTFASSIADRISVSLHAEQRQKAEGEIRRLNESLEQRVAARTVQLREVIEELDTFAYSVSHDLRAPLRAMTGFSQALLEDYADRPLDRVGQEYISRISESARRMDLLIQDLLHYSRLSRSQICLEPMNLAMIVKPIVDSMEREILAVKARIVVEEPLPDVRADRILLLQAVTNLVSNALKFVPPGVAPDVRIRAESKGGHVRLEIIDNGIGIAPEHQERIFKIFERLNSTAEYPGMGIGLALVRKATDRMGGKVGVESQPDRGSRFWIDLPGAD